MEIDKLGQTVTVGELIEHLQSFDPEANVVICLDGSSSFAEDGLAIELVDTDPPEVMISSDI